MQDNSKVRENDVVTDVKRKTGEVEAAASSALLHSSASSALKAF